MIFKSCKLIPVMLGGVVIQGNYGNTMIMGVCMKHRQEIWSIGRHRYTVYDNRTNILHLS